MGKINKKTQEQYIEGVTAIHDGYYGYTKTLYTRSKDRLIVTCPVHGDFQIAASKHQQGQGCRQCAFKRLGDASRDSKETFIAKSEPRHKDTYDYSLVVIVDDATKVDIICKKHGVFSMTPRDHKQGKGCPKCGRLKCGNKGTFNIVEKIKEWETIFDGKYNYSKVDLSAKGDEEIEIICPVHGSYWRTPHRHNSGRGCAKCAEFGFNKGKPAIFYILTYENIVKVGITNRDISDRVKGINRSSGLSFSAHTVIPSSDGAKIQDIEQRTLTWLGDRYKGIDNKFDGYTECYLDVDMDDLLSFVGTIK